MALKGKNMLDIKQENRSAILNLLHEQGAMSRKQIAAKLNLTPAAITNIVGDLLQDGLLYEGGFIEGKGAVGRKEILVDINTETFFAAGVYYGVERVVVSLTDILGTLIASRTFSYDYDNKAELVIGKVCRILTKMICKCEKEGKRCLGVGVCARGIVDDACGICHDSYGGWAEKDVPLLDMMRERLHVKLIAFQQNVRAQAIAYLFLQQEQLLESMLFVINDTGIGSAIVVNRKVYTGCKSKAAEIGHVLVEENGKRCRCGGHGCLETIASRKSMESKAMGICSAETTPVLWNMVGGDPKRLSLEQMVSAAEQGDTAIALILDTAAKTLGKVLRDYIFILDVQRIVFYGTVFEMPYFFSRMAKEIQIDDRNQHFNNMAMLTSKYKNLDVVCSPILAVRAFYRNGGGQVDDSGRPLTEKEQ